MRASESFAAAVSLLSRICLAIGLGSIASACSYRALEAKGAGTKIVSISCIELHENCTPKDLRFETVQFEMTTRKDVGTRLRQYVIQARCDLDGNDDVAFGPYHQGVRLDSPGNVPGVKGPDGLYHYTIYALPKSEGLGAIANSSFRKLRCSIWGVQMFPMPFPRTSYVEMTSAEFRASYAQLLLQRTAP